MLLLRQTLSSNPDGQMSRWTNEKKGFSVTIFDRDEPGSLYLMLP